MIVVSVDGLIVLGHEVKLGKTVRLAFTAANGESPSSQVVAKVTVSTTQLLTDELTEKERQQQAVLQLLR